MNAKVGTYDINNMRARRAEGYTYPELEKEFGYNRGTIHYRVRDVQLTPQGRDRLKQRQVKNRSATRERLRIISSSPEKREKLYQYHNPDGDPFFIKSNLTQKEQRLADAAFMLYLGEGWKRSNKHILSVANTDEKLLRTFIKFLRQICNVSEHKLKLRIVLHQKYNAKVASQYWSKQLNIPHKNIAINRAPVNKHSANKRINRTLPYGTATIAVYNVKLHEWFFKQMYQYLDDIS